MTAPKAGAWHDVAQGESVESVAAATGHATQTIWEAPENASLRDRRKDPHVLLPGDRLFVPPLRPKTFQVKTGAAPRFTVARPPSRLRLELRRDGKPRANEPFVLVVDGREARGTTDGDGRVDQPIPAGAAKATLTVGEGEDRATYELALRALDPVTEPTGIQARLANLGYDAGPADGAVGPRTRAAVAAFQRDEGLEATGEADAATQDALRQRHGG